MKILQDEDKSTTDEYKFAIKNGGELNIKVSNGSARHVVITFVDGKLRSVTDNFNSHCFELRSHWHIQSEIAKKIAELESRYL